MRGIFNFRIIILLSLLGVFYFFLCDFHIPIKNIGDKSEIIAHVDSIKNFKLFEMYDYDLVYYHYCINQLVYQDSITSNRLNGTVNKGDSLIVVVSGINPVRHTVKAPQDRKQAAYQLMGR